ncbi:MAG: lamin tail domain-containing protein [Prevotellaceae bacterium]|jgi:hypothetical protein|nr:lamin tail domain-containing protein [Prevotellaceae bacterium]
MRLLFFLFLCLPCVAAAQFSDDFETGKLDDWVQAPEGRWGASTVSALSGNYALKHVFNNTAAATDAAYRSLGGLQVNKGNTTWRFLLRHGYDPSASNRWAVFLFSNQAGSEWKSGGVYEGYALGVNMATPTNSDTLTLYAVRNHSFTVIRKTTVNWQNDITTTGTGAIEVARTGDGEWSIKVATTGNFEDLQPVAQPAKHDNYNEANYFGIAYQYTSAADMLLWMDDISVSFERVTLPTKISAAAQQGQRHIHVSFTQHLEAATVGEITNYTLTGASFTLAPAQVEAVNDKELLLAFENPLPRGPATLRVEKLRDENNNEVTGETDITIFYLLYGDVAINEIMAAPAPAVGLPEVSYIELYNRLEFPVPLNGWKMAYNATVGNIGAATVSPHGYLILCTSAAVEDMRAYGNATNVSYMSSLTKSGKTLQLRNNEGQLLSRVTYSDQWLPETKRAGGWSLEKIDANNLSESAANWTASTDARGGTPGMPNAVQAHNPDTEAPFITTLQMPDDNTLLLTFNELFDTTKATDVRSYIVNGGAGRPQHVWTSADNPQQITLRFASPFVQGVVYELTVSAPFCDLAGNAPAETPYAFGRLFTPLAGDVVLNEVLFNPPVNGVDFVEIYNRSDNIFDLQQLKLAHRDKDNKVAAIQSVSHPHYLHPREYAVFTTDLEAVRQFYSVPFPEKVAVLKVLPSYPDAEGCVTLLNENDDVIDEFLYSEKMHSGFIDNPEGISLERVNPAVKTAERANWQSAAQDAGFATPTFRNSQFNDSAGDRVQAFSLRHATFSPDGDGYQDVLYIDYNLPSDGYEASLTVYNVQGLVVRSLGKNVWLGASGSLSWDGTRDNGQRALSGLFIVFVQCYDVRGNVSVYKLPCAVALR